MLAVVGGKMLAARWLKETIGDHFNFYLLAVVLLILAGGVVAAVIASRRDRRQDAVQDLPVASPLSHHRS